MLSLFLRHRWWQKRVYITFAYQASNFWLIRVDSKFWVAIWQGFAAWTFFSCGQQWSIRIGQWRQRKHSFVTPKLIVYSSTTLISETIFFSFFCFLSFGVLFISWFLVLCLFYVSHASQWGSYSLWMGGSLIRSINGTQWALSVSSVIRRGHHSYLARQWTAA